jgi:polysaccharide pyruvyl transferase WcaK-like protein
MKIGILTYHSVFNFGANLQVLSTVEYLIKKGYEPIIINWMPYDLKQYFISITSKEQAKKHKEFVNKFLPISKICKTDDDIIDVINKEKIRGIIVGSDAVAQHSPILSRIIFPTRRLFTIIKPTNDKIYPNPFWGNFLTKNISNIPLIMMSASCQNTEYKKIFGKEKRNIMKSIQNFSYISVRDSWTQKMMEYLSFNANKFDITPDPVFAFNHNAGHLLPSKNRITSKYQLPEKYILISFNKYYHVGLKWVKDFKLIANNKGFKLIGLPMPQGLNDLGFDFKIPLPLSPLEWYTLIKYSSGYIGHNMHPIIVAIHNKIPFFSFDYYGITKLRFFINIESSKIYDLLNGSGLENNMYNLLGFRHNIPSPSIVFKRIIKFDTVKCKKLCKNKYMQYIIMMNKIEKIFFDSI